MGVPEEAQRLRDEIDDVSRYLDRLKRNLQRVEAEQRPAVGQHRRPKLRVIKGGVSALVGPFVLLAHQARDYAMAATAAAVAVPVAITTGAVIAEAPTTPAESAQQPATLDVGTTGPLLVPDLVSPPRNPPAAAGTPSSTPNPTVRATPEPAAAEMVPLPPTLVPLADPTATPTPTSTAEPTPEPSPTAMPWTQVSAIAWCLEQLGTPPIGLHGCVDDLTG